MTETVEQEIVRKNLTGPRITPDDLEATIKSDYFHNPPGTTLTLCVLTLQNGFNVVGESACADPANFDRELGRRIARDNAKNKMWPLLGYALREKLNQV